MLSRPCHLVALAIVFLVCCAGNGFAGETLTPSSFSTKATIAVDNNHLSLTTAIATIEPRLGAAGYSWLRISFYTFQPSADDLPNIMRGNLAAMDNTWQALASKDVNAYNLGNATLQLSIDSAHNVGQIDISVPGHSCTVAASEAELKNALQTYHFDGKTLVLKSKATHLCDMAFMKIPNQTFSWDVDLTTAVFEKLK